MKKKKIKKFLKNHKSINLTKKTSNKHKIKKLKYKKLKWKKIKMWKIKINYKPIFNKKEWN